jgi:hypothetical protein
VLALAAVVASLASAAQSSGTDLRIAYWAEGREQGNPVVRRLHCDPPGGTVPAPAVACRRLLALERPFMPVPEGSACTQIYGGPQEARVTGTLGGRRVWVTFRRSDGCEIARWNRVAFLFPRRA